MKQFAIAQIDTILDLTRFNNFQSGIWWSKLTATPDEKSSSPLVTVLGGNLDDINEIALTIGSVSVGVEQYSPVASLDEMYVQTKSFLWDQANQIIYIRFDNPYWIFDSITGGKVTGFINQANIDSADMPTDLIIGSVYYEPRLIFNSIKANQSIDPLQFGTFIFDDISFDIDNSDGEYDNLNELSAGQGIRLLYASCEDDCIVTADDFTLFRRGFVETINFKGSDRLTVQGQDSRKKWTDKINTEFLTIAEYSGLQSKDVDKRKPLCIGVCYNVECIQIDTTKFLFSTDTYGDMISVDQMYLDGVATAHTGVETDGTFIFAGYTTGKVTADVTGVDKGTDVEKILFLLDQFQNLAFIASNFNIGEINIAILESKTGGYYISKSGIKLDNAIEELLQNVGGNLIQQGDKFTIRVYDVDRPASREIFLDEMDGFPDREYNETQFFSSVTTLYHKDESEKEYFSNYDDSKEEEAIANQYRLANKEIKTTLLSKSDAADIGERFYDRFVNIPATIKATLLTDIAGLYPSDVITYTHTRNNGTIILDRSNYEIEDIDWFGKGLILGLMKEAPVPVYTVKYLGNHYLANHFLSGGLS